jgi:hypothetical protein
MKIESGNFKRLIGIWNTEGQIYSQGNSAVLTGADTYEFILDGNYILHKADVKMGNERTQTFEIIALDNSPGQVTMNYYNSKAETGVMKGSLIGDEFKIDSDALKFEGSINKENSELVGKWFQRMDSDEWTLFIDLKLSKQGDGKQYNQ